MISASLGSMASAVDELRQLAGPLFGAIEKSGMAMLVTNPRLPDDPIVFANSAFTRLTGYTPGELFGRNCRLLQGPDTNRETVAEIRASLRTEAGGRAELLNYRKDGSIFWNSLFITAVLDSTDRPAFFLSTQVDVTAAHVAASTASALEANQKQLREANERMRATLSVSGAVAAWEWHVDGGRIVGDTGFATLYGLKEKAAADGVNAKTFFSIIHPEDEIRIRLAVGGMLRGAQVFSKDFRILPGDGSIRWVHARGRCEYDEESKPVLFSGVLVDITEQKRVEERLRIAQTAGGIGTFEYIDGFGTVSVSTQFCSLLGLRAARDLPVRTVNAVVHPQDTPIIDMAARPKPNTASQVDFRITRPDNGEVRWLTRRGEYLRDADTSGLRFVGVIYDITHSKHTEEQLRDLNETLESRVESRTRERDRIWRVSRDLYVLCSIDGVCQSINPAWDGELGYEEWELRGRKLNHFVHADDRPKMEAMTARLMQGDFVEGIDVRMIHKNGEARSYSWTCVPEGDSFFAAGRDITHRNELEEQLRQSQKMEAVGQLTGGIAHDFNNMLTGITGSLDLARRRMAQGNSESIERLIDVAMTSAERAAALTHRLLAFSRRQSLDIKALDINKMVASMEDLLYRTLGEQISLKVELAADLWLGLSDVNQLESALLNLAINARDAMPKGGTLAIATGNVTLTDDPARAHPELPPGDYVIIRVSDTGTGMAADVVAKAFDPFFTTKPLGHGTGLGLSMIYGFAKQSGGHVHIASEIGHGTSVTLYTRRYVDAEAIVDVGPSTQPLPNADGETVFVIEDDAAVRMLVLEALTELGYKTIEATDYRTALPILDSPRRIDLMVSDVGLPGMNGRQLAEIARQRRPGLKVLFMTGYAENAAVRSDFLASGMDMITKPFKIDILAIKIREMLRK